MTDSDRVVVTDWDLAHGLGLDVRVGSVFAFFNPFSVTAAGRDWATTHFGSSLEPRVLSLLGPEGFSFPGVNVRAVPLPRLSLASVTSDKALYREGRDEVHLLALDPLAPDTEVVLELLVNEALFTSRPARLDARGAAAVAVRELPVGDYTVRFQGAPADAPACEFTVARYQLAPLVARLVEQRLDGRELSVKLLLESFGAPVTSRVRLELLDRGLRREEKVAVARTGLLETSFHLEGRGPFAINVQLLLDPSRTATVPLVGTREEERSPTVLSTLGEEVSASLLPGAASRPVRGLWLKHGAIRSTPFHLERVDTTKARLVAKVDIDTARLAVFDGKGEHRELALGGLASGAVIEVDIPEPMGVLALGAFVGGEAWEGWAAVMRPAMVTPVLTVPPRSTPGGEARIELDTGRTGDDASVYVVVKDARLLSTDTPGSRLATGLKTHAANVSCVLYVGTTETRLQDLLPRRFGHGMVYSDGAYEAEAGVVYSSGYTPDEYADGPFMLGAPTSPRGAEPPPARNQREPEVLFAGLVPTRNGRASLEVRLGPDLADYLVEAFVIAGMDWASTEARFRAEQEQYVSLELPAFVHAEDAALARLHVGTRLEGVKVRLLRDGVEVPLLHAGRLLAPGEVLGAGRAELMFLAGPGQYEALLENGSGVLARAAKQVEEPGRLRRLARTVRLLEPGQALSLDEDASFLSLRVIPGLKGPFRALVDATADYGHACCEQTAAKILAACAMYALADGGERAAIRAKAESIILAGIEREESMYLPGNGFKMYPESALTPDTYWGSKAAKHLQNLALLKELRGEAAIGPALEKAVARGLAMASDAMRAYSLSWPPKYIESCEEGYLALRFGGDERAAEALAVARRYAEAARDDGGDAVAMRAEKAHAAAILLRAGGTPELPRAIALANQVIARIGDNGRLYSTVDSVAAIALLIELQAARVVGVEGMAEVEGERVAIVEEAARAREVRSVRALDSRVAVEVTRWHEEDWGTFHSRLPVAVSLHKGSEITRNLNATDAVELRVCLESGYEPGDLLWVCLPDALSRVVGGGQVKQFSVDFGGENELRIPLAATGVTVGRRGEVAPARFAVCVRNMFKEERGGSPGYIEVTVAAAPGGNTVFARTLEALKHLFH